MAIAIEQEASGPAGYSEFRRGWKVVLASLLGIGFGLAPMPFYTIGVFAPHLAKEFGWSISQIIGGVTVTTLMVLWAAPVVGLIAVRVGVRRVALTSGFLFGLAFMSLALSNGSLTQYYVTWAAVAILGAGTLPMTWTRAVNHWFEARKGLALGLSMIGIGLFGFACKPFLAWLIGDYGWRAAYVGLGLLPLLIAFPTAYFLFHDTDSHPKAAVRTTTPGGLSLGQALRQWRFWLLAAALVPISFALAGPVPNLETILKGGGLAPEQILLLTPMVGLSSLVGRLVGGWLLDRLWAPAVGFILVSLPGLSCWLLTGTDLSYPTAALSIFLIGFALGVEYDLVAFFVARYFGLRNYAAIYSVLYVFFSLGAGFGPLAFGWDFDRHGDTHLALMVSFVVLIAAAASFLLLGRYPRFADEPLAPATV